MDLKKQPDHMKGFKKKKLQKFSNWLFSGNRAEMSGTLSHFTIGLMLCLAPELKRRANYLNIECLLDLNYQMDGEKIKLEVDKVDSCPLSENEFCLKSIAFKYLLMPWKSR